jgi:hypothetical protein
VYALLKASLLFEVFMKKCASFVCSIALSILSLFHGTAWVRADGGDLTLNHKAVLELYQTEKTFQMNVRALSLLSGVNFAAAQIENSEIDKIQDLIPVVLELRDQSQAMILDLEREFSNFKEDFSHASRSLGDIYGKYLSAGSSMGNRLIEASILYGKLFQGKNALKPETVQKLNQILKSEVAKTPPQGNEVYGPTSIGTQPSASTVKVLLIADIHVLTATLFQRVPRYGLLIKEIQKTASSLVDFAGSVQIAKALADELNRQLRIAEFEECLQEKQKEAHGQIEVCKQSNLLVTQIPYQFGDYTKASIRVVGGMLSQWGKYSNYSRPAAAGPAPEVAAAPQSQGYYPGKYTISAVKYSARVVQGSAKALYGWAQQPEEKEVPAEMKMSHDIDLEKADSDDVYLDRKGREELEFLQKALAKISNPAVGPFVRLGLIREADASVKALKLVVEKMQRGRASEEGDEKKASLIEIESDLAALQERLEKGLEQKEAK